MKPEQRARMEANMKGMAGKPQVSKYCVTKQELSNAGAWGSEDKSCKRTIVTSSRGKQEVRFECARENGTSSGTMRIEAQLGKREGIGSNFVERQWSNHEH
jgi:hypothetical protein